MQGTDNLHEILATNKKEGNADNQKFFLARKVGFPPLTSLLLSLLLTIFFLQRVSVDSSQDMGVLRVFGGPLDLDVAYRALFVDINATAEQVVTSTLEKYNSRDSPKDYYLVLHTTGAETSELSSILSPSTGKSLFLSFFRTSLPIYFAGERTMEKSERPLEVSRNFEEEHPGDHIKFLLKKAGAVPKTSMPTIKLTNIPVRIYCEFQAKGGAPTFKPVLVSEAMNSASVVFLAIEKFNIKSNLTIQDYTLVLVNDETGVRRLLLADEFPLQVKNEVGKKVSVHLTKVISPSLPPSLPPSLLPFLPSHPVS